MVDILLAPLYFHFGKNEFFIEIIATLYMITEKVGTYKTLLIIFLLVRALSSKKFRDFVIKHKLIWSLRLFFRYKRISNFFNKIYRFFKKKKK